MSDIMAKFIDTCFNKSKKGYEIISMYGNCFSKNELLNILKELLYSISVNCSPELNGFILEDMAVELEDMYSDYDDNDD